MIGLVRNEWKKVFLPVLLTTVLLAIAMGVLSCTIYQNYVLHYDLEAWEVGTELFSLLYPLFVVVPLCWNLYYERKNNFLLYIMPRVKIKKYLTAKWIAYALGTLCIIVIPYILSAVFALYVKPPVVPFVENPFSHIFENAFIKTPLLYAVALSLWRGIVSLFVMTFGFVLALYCKNIFVILTGPFMYSILENFVLAILCLERLRLVVAFDPTTVNPEVVSIFSFFFGPIVLSIVIGLTAFLLSKKNAIVSQILERVSDESLKTLSKEKIAKVFPKQFSNAKSRLVLKTPKTEGSLRKQYLTRPLVQEIKERIAEINKAKELLGPEYQDNGFLICQPDGRPVDPNNLCKSFKEWQSTMNITDQIDLQGLRKSGQMHKIRLTKNNYQLVAANAGQSPEVLMHHYNEALEAEKQQLASMVESSFYPSLEKKSETAATLDPAEILKLIQENPDLAAKLMQLLKVSA